MASTATYPPIPPSDPTNVQQTPNHEQHSTIPAPSGTTVRTNGLQFLRTSWQNISRASKIMLVSTVFFITSQIAVSIVILSLYQKATCDKPLNTYLTIFVVRSGLLLPLLIYQYLTRPSFLQRQQQQQHELRERQIQNRYQLRIAAASRQNLPPSSVSPSSSTSTSSLSPPPTSTRPAPATPSPVTPPIRNNRQNSNGSVKEWCERLKSLLDLFGILWFIVGNYLVFTSDDCPYLASGLYYTTMAWVVLSYIVILLPVILCASVIFCLPCVLVALRLLNINDIPGMEAGANQEDILKIPTYKYQSLTGDGSTESTTPSDHQPKKPRFFTLWTRRFLTKFKKNKNDVEAKAYPPITIACADDAMCSICLSEYETGDLICKLWCGHHFGKDCLHEWLGLNSLCPLCKQDFRGKEFNASNDLLTEQGATPSSA